MNVSGLIVLLSLSAAHGALSQQLLTAAPQKTIPAGTGAAADKFHQMLARSNGAWTGQATMTFSPGAPPITSTSTLTNTMVMGGLYQLSEINYNINGQRITGVRVTGYDANKQIFTRAMIQDGGNGVAMEGPWDDASKSITMRYKQRNSSTGTETEMKEVYTIVDENTEVLEIYRQDPKAQKEFKILNVKWTRNK
jgi:hypothetical protein